MRSQPYAEEEGEVKVMIEPGCFYCHSKEGPFHEDHVIPFSRGGTSLPRNMVLACKKCNLEKGDRLPSEWMAEPALPERVYELERMLVEWHESLDSRRKAGAYGLPIGSWVFLENRFCRIEAIDGRGVRLLVTFVHRLAIYACETCGCHMLENETHCVGCGAEDPLAILTDTLSGEFVDDVYPYVLGEKTNHSVCDARWLAQNEAGDFIRVEFNVLVAEKFQWWKPWSAIPSLNVFPAPVDVHSDAFLSFLSECWKSEMRVSTPRSRKR